MALMTDPISISEPEALQASRRRLLLRAILLVSLISLLWASAVYAFWKLEQGEVQARLETELKHHLEKSISLLDRQLRQSHALMLAVQDSRVVQSFLQAGAAADMGQLLGIFAPIEGLIAEFNLLDNQGHEIIHLTHAGNGPLMPLPTGELQSRAAARWFQAAHDLDANLIYLAPLSVEEQSAYPVSLSLPVLRMATPVFAGNRRLGVMKFILDGSQLYQPHDLSPLPGMLRVLKIDGEHHYLIRADDLKRQSLDVAAAPVGMKLEQSAELKPAEMLPLGRSQQSLIWQVLVGIGPEMYGQFFSRVNVQSVILYLLGQLLVLFGIGLWFVNHWHLLELERQRQRLLAELAISRASLLAIDAGVAIIDMQQPDQPIIDCNPGFERLTGYTRDEILGRNCCFLQGDDTEQPGLAIIRESMAQRKSCQVQLRNYRKNGNMFHSQVLLSPIVNAGGTLTHYIGILHDISADIEAEKDRHALQEEVHALSQSLIKKRDQQGLLWANWLHDTVGQKLAALSSLSFVLAGQELGKYGQSVLHDMQDLVEELISDMRKQLNSLKPSYVEEIGLQDAIERRMEGWFLAGKIRVSSQVDAALEALPLPTKVAVMQSLTDMLQRISEVCPFAGSLEVVSSMGDEVHLDAVLTGDWNEHALESLAREFVLGST